MGTALIHHSCFAQVVTANNHEVLLFGVAQELAHQSKEKDYPSIEVHYTDFCPFWQGVIMPIFADTA